MPHGTQAACALNVHIRWTATGPLNGFETPAVRCSACAANDSGGERGVFGKKQKREPAQNAPPGEVMKNEGGARRGRSSGLFGYHWCVTVASWWAIDTAVQRIGTLKFC